MKIVVLDAATLGSDLDLSILNQFGEVTSYSITQAENVADRIKECDVVIINKIKLNESNLSKARNLKLICVAATGFDNIDVNYCKENNIAVCNVCGYSTESVSQLTVAMAMSLCTNLTQFDKYVKRGDYTKSGLMNCLEPVYHEISSMTWGVIGLGNIGKRVAGIARALGCNVLGYARTPKDGYNCVDIDTLCKESDIISIHTPLNEGTKNLINQERINLMKNTAIVINVARGAVTDEIALANALIDGKIGGLGIDVYSKEPFDSDHIYNKLLQMDNAILTPHMAWGAYESRVKCLNEIAENITSFFNGEIRNRVDI